MRFPSLAIIAVLAASPVSASALTLSPSPDAQGRSVVNAVFRDYIAQRVGIQVETAVTDVEADGIAEIVARFVHSGSCRDKSSQCRTVVIRYGDDKKWGIILDRPADKIEVEKPAGTWLFTDILVDGVRWKWNGASYAPTPGSLGTKVDLSPVPKETAGVIASAFGPGAVKLVASGAPGAGVSFEYARPKVAASGEHLLVMMKGDVSCGDISGCPVRLLEKDGNAWRPILSASSLGDVEVSRVTRSGRNDIVLRTEKGFVILGWGGSSYGIADVVEAPLLPHK